MATINIKVDDTLKAEAEKEFKEMGLSTSAAIALFLNAVRKNHGIPFPITNIHPDEQYNMRVLGIKDYAAYKKLVNEVLSQPKIAEDAPVYATTQDAFDDILGRGWEND